MWFEVNVRLSEVTDLRWPHGTEWQCGNPTLAMSWPNHVQILSFASMGSRQGAVKHGFVRKFAGGFFSYDVITPWPDLTWSIFLPKVAQGLSHKVPPKPGGAMRRRFFRYCEKTSGGGGGPSKKNPIGSNWIVILIFQIDSLIGLQMDYLTGLSYWILLNIQLDI